MNDNNKAEYPLSPQHLVVTLVNISGLWNLSCKHGMFVCRWISWALTDEFGKIDPVETWMDFAIHFFYAK